MTSIILSTAFALCAALALVIMAGALYLHILGRRLADVSARLQAAKRAMRLAVEPDDRAARRVEVTKLEREMWGIEKRIRRIESFL